MSASAESLALLLRIAVAVEKLAGIESPKPNLNNTDLDSQYGDEKIKFSPRDWSGPDFKNAPMSTCPPELLDLYASAHDHFAQKNDDKGEKANNGQPKSTYDRRTARRARGWAARKRAGWTAPEPAAGLNEGDREPRW